MLFGRLISLFKKVYIFVGLNYFNSMRYKIILLTIAFILSNCLIAQYTEIPVTVKGLQHQKVDLNGEWQFNPMPVGNYWKLKQTESSWDIIKVPGEWVLQGYTVKSLVRAAYFRTINLPSGWSKNCRIFLRCDAVFSDAVVWINGEKAGAHLGGMTAFDFDVTDLVKPGKENVIVLGVLSESIADTLMSGSQYAAHPLGGILRKIYMYAVPEIYLGDLSIVTDFDDEYKDATLKIKGSVFNSTGKQAEGLLSIQLFRPDGVKELLSKAVQNISFEKREKQIETEIIFEISAPLKWDAEHPNLYQLYLSIESENNSETIIKQFGFREIEIVGNQVFLNGRPISLHGVNRHETHPLLGRSLNRELWLKDALLFKQANVNYIRTSHYPPGEEFLAICDSIGLYVELENPLCWVGHGANAKWEKSASHDSTYYPYFEQVSKESIGLLGNHPSILIWSLANESAWGPNWVRLLDFYNNTDPTRPKTFHDQAYGGYNNYGSTDMQIANIHYPGLNGPAVADTFNRPLLFGEYSHLNCYNRMEIATDPGVRDSWGKGLKAISNTMSVSRGCLGGAIWSGIDDIFYLPEGKAVGYGEWGPVDGWRRKKPEYYHMKKAYSPVIIYNTSINAPGKGQPVMLQIENRFDFTNFNECKIEWDMAGETGIVNMDLPPRSQGILKIYPESDSEGKLMHIRTYSSLGYLVDETTICIGDIQRADYPYKHVSADSWELNTTGPTCTVRSNRMAWNFDRASGKLTSAVLDQQEILKGNTELMMLPLNTGPCATEHSLDIPFLNNKCKDWKMGNVNAVQKQDTITVTITGTYLEASGEIVYVFIPGGQVQISYRFISKADINPRQWGMVLDLNGAYKNLEWSRNGIWTEYPKDHIGRTRGEAIPFESGEYQKPAFGKQPENKWYHDANQLGSNDFRSTKENIYWTTLTDDTGKGIVINGNGTQSVRSWQEGTDINMLVTGFNTGGGDMFFSGYYKDERNPLKIGDEFSGTIEIFMIEEE